MFVVWHVLQITVNFLNNCILPDLINEIILLLYYFQNSSARIMWIGQVDTTYPRVLPASLPRVSEPERNHGESLVLPGLEVLPAPELLFSFDLGKIKRWTFITQPRLLGRYLQASPQEPPVQCLPARQVLLPNSCQVGMLATPTKMCARWQLPNTHIPSS